MFQSTIFQSCWDGELKFATFLVMQGKIVFILTKYRKEISKVRMEACKMYLLLQLT